MFPFCRVEDSDLEDYDHEAAGERIGSMLDNLKRHPQIVAVFPQCLCGVSRHHVGADPEVPRSHRDHGDMATNWARPPLLHLIWLHSAPLAIPQQLQLLRRKMASQADLMPCRGLTTHLLSKPKADRGDRDGRTRDSGKGLQRQAVQNSQTEASADRTRVKSQG